MAHMGKSAIDDIGEIGDIGKTGKIDKTGRIARVLVAITLLASACASNRGIPAAMLGWSAPVSPFRVADNIYFVGNEGMAFFLITTPVGHILLDTGFEAKVPQLRASVEALGFRFTDIKILLASHAHIDHVQAHALVRKLTGARVVASRADAMVIASGGKGEWAYRDTYAWTPCPVDTVIEDGGTVELGGTTLVAHVTPGHTRGATTWTTTVHEDGRALAVLFFPSASVPPGARLVNNPDYPDVIRAYENSFAIWRRLPCQIFLGAHGSFFDLAGKSKRLAAGERPNPFIDPDGYARALTDFEARFHAAVASQS
jgi:metallo-beta-lactamase class B